MTTDHNPECLLQFFKRTLKLNFPTEKSDLDQVLYVCNVVNGRDGSYTKKLFVNTRVPLMRWLQTEIAARSSSDRAMNMVRTLDSPLAEAAETNDYAKVNKEIADFETWATNTEKIENSLVMIEINQLCGGRQIVINPHYEHCKNIEVLPEYISISTEFYEVLREKWETNRTIYLKLINIIVATTIEQVEEQIKKFSDLVYSSGSSFASVKTSPIVASDTMPALNVPIIEDVVDVENPELTNALCQPKVHIRDRRLVHDKLKRMISEGPDKLMIITDFDFTLSRFEDDDGHPCWTTHDVLPKNISNKSVRRKFTDLKDKYFLSESDQKLTDEEKIRQMKTWWSTSHSHIVSAGFLKSTIEKFVSHSKIILRDGTTGMIRMLTDKAVPFLVVSSGIGDIIAFFLEQELGAIPPNTHIISNMMQFNKQGRVIPLSQSLIHTVSKNSSVIGKEAGFFHEVAQRTNLIIIGDGLDDVHMNVDVERDGPTLKIGFLNNNVVKSLDSYMDAYDIVIENDNTMRVPDTLLDTIVKSV